MARALNTRAHVQQRIEARAPTPTSQQLGRDNFNVAALFPQLAY